MGLECARCEATIQADDVKYRDHGTDDDTATYCSVNCIADVDHFDEADARDRLFAERVET